MGSEKEIEKERERKTEINKKTMYTWKIEISQYHFFNSTVTLGMFEESYKQQKQGTVIDYF